MVFLLDVDFVLFLFVRGAVFGVAMVDFLWCFLCCLPRASRLPSSSSSSSTSTSISSTTASSRFCNAMAGAEEDEEAMSRARRDEEATPLLVLMCALAAATMSEEARTSDVNLIVVYRSMLR